MSKLTDLNLHPGTEIRRTQWATKGTVKYSMDTQIPLHDALADDWELFVEPKRKKTITLYASIRKTRNMSGDFYFLQGEFNSEKSAPSGVCPHVGWAEIEVEIEG
jgi:uncharacterized protein YhdP